MKRLKSFFGAIGLALVLFLGVLMLIPQESLVQAQGGVTGFDNLRVTNFYRAAPRTAISVTMNGTVNPTGTNQRLDMAGSVSTSGASITVKPSGSFLVITNDSSFTVTFTETGTLVSSGNIVLGPNDSAMLLSDGTNWNQISESDN